MSEELRIEVDVKAKDDSAKNTLDGLIKASLTMSLLNLVFTYSFRYVMIKIFILLTPFAILSLLLENTSWFFKSWLRNIFSLLFIQIIVAIVLLIISSKVMQVLDVNGRSARYLTIAIVGFVCWIFDKIFGKKE